MKNFRWSVGAAAACVLALSAYGCSSDSAADDADDDGTSSSGKSGSSGKADGGKSDGGKSSSGGSSGRSSSSGGGNTSSGGGSSSGDTDTDAGEEEDGGTVTDGGSVTDGGGNGACIPVTTGLWRPVEQCGTAPNNNQQCASWFEARFSPEVDGSLYNMVSFQFNPQTTTIGTPYTLALANSAQRASGYAADDAAQRNFVAESGTATLDSYVNTAQAFVVDATLTNVKFVEATLTNNVWAPVQGGACLTLATAAVEFAD